jgi:hypothetical protein
MDKTVTNTGMSRIKITADLHIGGKTIENCAVEVWSDTYNREYGWCCVINHSFTVIKSLMDDSHDINSDGTCYGSYIAKDSNIDYNTGSGKALYTITKISPRKTEISASGYRRSIEDGCIHICLNPTGISTLLWGIVFNKELEEYIPTLRGRQTPLSP